MNNLKSKLAGGFLLLAGLMVIIGAVLDYQRGYLVTSPRTRGSGGIARKIETGSENYQKFASRRVIGAGAVVILGVLLLIPWETENKKRKKKQS